MSTLVIKAGGAATITELGHSIIDLDDIDITETKNRIAVVVEYDNIGSPSTNTIVHSFNSAGVKNSDVLELDISTIKPSLAGPKRPQDRVTLDQVGESFITLQKEYEKAIICAE